MRRKEKRRGVLRQLLSSLGKAWRRLFGRRAPTPAGSAQSVRAGYEEILREETSRISRYKQSVAYFMSRWRQKKSRLIVQGQKIERQEERREKVVAETTRLVDRLEAAGMSKAEIKSDARYERCLKAFELSSTELTAQRKRFAELQADTREELERLRDHEAQLQELADKLKRLEEESAEASADMVAAQLEQEVLDGMSGSRRETERELEGLRRQVRKAEAVVKVGKEASGFDRRAEEAEYLEVARRFDAAAELEARLGLGEGTEQEPRREEPLAE